jgi:hypothetical protein
MRAIDLGRDVQPVPVNDLVVSRAVRNVNRDRLPFFYPIERPRHLPVIGDRANGFFRPQIERDLADAQRHVRRRIGKHRRAGQRQELTASHLGIVSTRTAASCIAFVGWDRDRFEDCGNDFPSLGFAVARDLNAPPLPRERIDIVDQSGDPIQLKKRNPGFTQTPFGQRQRIRVVRIEDDHQFEIGIAAHRFEDSILMFNEAAIPA